MKKKLLLFMMLTTRLAFSQENCSNAISLNSSGLYTINTISGGTAPVQLCAENGTGNMNSGKWYAYTPTQNYTVTVTSNIAANTPRVDTRFHVYIGSCNSLNCYAGDDDSGLDYSSSSTFNVSGGTTYYICWDNRWTSNGFTFQLIENPYVEPEPTPISYTTQYISTITTDYNSCVVDMNGDYLDDIVGVSSTNIRVHQQTSNNGFNHVDYPTTAANNLPDWSIAAGDYNKDGFNDLLYGSGNGLTFMKSNSTGTSYTEDSPGQYIFCQRTNFVDINNDGNLDAFSCHDVAPNVYYINNGLGSFAHFQSGVTPNSYNLGTLSSGGNYASLWTDFDNDGDSDMFVSKCSGPPCELYRNNGNNSYSNISSFAQIDFTPVQSWSSAIADFDNDGDMDIMVGSNGNVGHRLFRNELDTTNATEESFSDITTGSGLENDTSTNRDYIAYDFDNDGKVDIMGGGNKIFFNQGNNAFDAVSYPNMSVGAIGDLNNDGFLDIYRGDFIRFAVPNSNKWIKISLKGIQSNSNGIGARVELYGPWGKQIRDVRSGEGFSYMSTLNVHFGIGQSNEISEVVIRWPSGIVDTIQNPSPNQTLHVIEGSTLSSADFSSLETNLYPVPASTQLNLFSKNNIIFKTAMIFDCNGKKVIESSITDNFINIEKLATGNYVILLYDDNNKIYRHKFIKN